MKSEKSGSGSMMYEQRGKLAIIHPAGIERIVVAGDIHGDLHVFKRIMSIAGPGDLVVFLGDYADRGPAGLEVLERLMTAAGKLPGRVLPLKGNHEDFSPGGDPRFQPCTLIEETFRKGRSWKDLFPVLKAFFDTLPLAALIPGFALLLHGGISGEISSPETIERANNAVETDIIWSDPGAFPGQHPNPRGAGKRFGPDVTAKVLSAFGVRYLIRSHEPRKAPDGPFFEHNGCVITTSATSVYGGRPFVLLMPVKKLPGSRRAFSGCTEYLS